MNVTESFQEFSSRLSTMDLALYAGVGIIVWVLFKDKLSPVQKMIMDFINNNTNNHKPSVPVIKVPSVDTVLVPVTSTGEDTFFKLVVSWKQTRDLAVESGCEEAVKVADQMFPFLSPNVCQKKESKQ